MPYKDPVIQKQRQQEIQRSFHGYLVLKHKSMRARVIGGQTANPKYFIGREVMPKEEFMEWALKNKDYKRLHKQWVKSNYQYTLAPVFDRLDSSKGYVISNLECVTVQENSSRATAKRRAKSASVGL